MPPTEPLDVPLDGLELPLPLPDEGAALPDDGPEDPLDDGDPLLPEPLEGGGVLDGAEVAVTERISWPSVGGGVVAVPP